MKLDVSTLPYNAELLSWLREQKAPGRRLVLCTASDKRYARAVAGHLGLFDEVIASDGHDNMSRAAARPRSWSQRFGERGFDYAGNSRDDLPVWARARDAPSSSTRRRRWRTRARQRFDVAAEFAPPPRATAATWLRAMRLHQWLKNLLVLLPLAGASSSARWSFCCRR